MKQSQHCDLRQGQRENPRSLAGGFKLLRLVSSGGTLRHEERLQRAAVLNIEDVSTCSYYRKERGNRTCSAATWCANRPAVDSSSCAPEAPLSWRTCLSKAFAAGRKVYLLRASRPTGTSVKAEGGINNSDDLLEARNQRTSFEEVSRRGGVDTRPVSSADVVNRYNPAAHLVRRPEEQGTTKQRRTSSSRNSCKDES